MQKEIRWLLKEKYHWTEAEILLNQRLPLPEETFDIKRLEQGEPVAYVIGKTEFLGCVIDLSLRPLIPRPETEYWVNQAIKGKNRVLPDSGSTRMVKALDLCCGSGCIGIALLKHLSNVSVDFVDIDDNALKQTEINLKLNLIRGDPRSIRDNPLQGLSLIKSDLFSSLKGRRYDCIFCNPPYVNPNGKFDKNLKFEPKEALFAKDNGMFFINKILRGFTKYLKPNGILYLEFGDDQKVLIERKLKLLERSKRRDFSFHKDQFGKWRYLKIEEFMR
ncbi:peptide chain release factor N(5)-glutamine methyltransferase [Candidatus Parcubacteria bacterium]|nr:peptide chain release factor N(5)-glutamine methyltransferase [Patescibacteria group bacterium]MCG2688897.1 peptide chain release factor N(5)-glutamine methyltransferase [Candidatus Parcubacteria bacterium]